MLQLPVEKPEFRPVLCRGGAPKPLEFYRDHSWDLGRSLLGWRTG